MRIFKQVTTILLTIWLFFPLFAQTKEEYRLPNLVNSIDETSLSNPAYVTGQYWFRQIHSSKGFINYPPAYEYLRDALSILLPVTELHQKKIELGLLNSTRSNAFVLPGNHLFIYSEMLRMIDTEQKLQALLAHELAHLDLKHYERRLENNNQENNKALLLIGAGFAAALSGADGNATSALFVGGIANKQENILVNSRRHEAEADKQARNYLQQAGLDPNSMTELFLAFFQSAIGRPKLEFLSTHPIADSRFSDSIEGTTIRNNHQNSPSFNDFRTILIAYRAAIENNSRNIIFAEIKSTQQRNHALALTALLKNDLVSAQNLLNTLDEGSNAQAYLKASIQLALGFKGKALTLIEEKLSIIPNSLMFQSLKEDKHFLTRFSYFDQSLLQYERNLISQIQIKQAKQQKNLPMTLAYQALESFSKGDSYKAFILITRAKELVEAKDEEEINIIEESMNTVIEAEILYDISP